MERSTGERGIASHPLLAATIPWAAPNKITVAKQPQEGAKMNAETLIGKAYRCIALADRAAARALKNLGFGPLVRVKVSWDRAHRLFDAAHEYARLAREGVR